MFKRHLWPAVQWIYGSILQIWCYLACPLRRRERSTELPLASPVVPSTPSFIQTQEPNFHIDAMRIFQLNNEVAHASHLARHKVAIHKMRTAPPNINRIASLSSTDPSPGFSLLTDVIDNLVTPVDTHSPSLYSSPPSSPSSSLHTPCIVVSGPMADTTPRDDASLSLDFGLQRDPRNSELRSISQGELPFPRRVSPDIYGLAKRRNFKGSPIITNISRDFLPFHPTRLSQGSVTPTDWRTQQNLSRPKSALAAVTNFVRASTNISSRNVSREALVIFPELQSAFTQSSPFSAQAESFFIDDQLSSPGEFDIHDLGIYADAGSTLNLQVPRRKRKVVAPPSFCMPTNNYGNPILAKGMTNTLRERTRSLPGMSDLINTSAGIPDSSTSPASLLPSTAPSRVSDDQEGSFLGLSIRKSEFDSDEQHIPPSVEVDEEWTVSSRLSLYASLVFPFSLEDSISWDTGQDYDFVDLNCTVHREEPILGVVALDKVVVDAVGTLESLQFPGTPSTLSTSDHQWGNLPLPVNVVNTGDDLDRDDSAMPVSPKNPSVLFLSPAIDKSFVAGSTTLAGLGIHTEYLLDMRSGGPCEEGNDTAVDLRESSLRQVDYVLDGPFFSPGESSVLPPVFESMSCVSPQTFSSATIIASIDNDVAQNVDIQVTNRRARRVGFYGPPFSPVVTRDPLLSNSEERPDRSTSERRRSPSRRESRHGSALRPLVLPMRVATRDLSTGDRSFEWAPDMRLESNRTSIGYPPPFPLPELPLYKSSSTSTIVASGFPRDEELDTFQKSRSISARSLTLPEPLSTYSAPDLEESYPDSDGRDSTQTVNWGVAF